MKTEMIKVARGNGKWSFMSIVYAAFQSTHLLRFWWERLKTRRLHCSMGLNIPIDAWDYDEDVGDWTATNPLESPTRMFDPSISLLREIELPWKLLTVQKKDSSNSQGTDTIPPVQLWSESNVGQHPTATKFTTFWMDFVSVRII